MKFKTLFILPLFLFLSSQVAAGDRFAPFTMVKNPQPTQTGEKIEIIEFFWYGCPHCYALEPELEAWASKLPDDVEFVRIPGILARNWIPLAKAYYTAEKLGIVEQIHRPLFNAIHNDGKHMNDINILKKFFANYGVTEEGFLEIYESEEIQDKVKQAYIVGKNYAVSGVPTMIVNGKYMTSPSITGSNKATIEAMDMLIEKERPKTATAE